MLYFSVETDVPYIESSDKYYQRAKKRKQDKRKEPDIYYPLQVLFRYKTG